jgi:hypothetical protein
MENIVALKRNRETEKQRSRETVNSEQGTGNSGRQRLSAGTEMARVVSKPINEERDPEVKYEARWAEVECS